MDQVFSARTVRYGGVVRRSTRWVDAEVGRTTFIDYVRTQGWHLAESNGHYVVFCTDRPVTMHF